MGAWDLPPGSLHRILPVRIEYLISGAPLEQISIVTSLEMNISWKMPYFQEETYLSCRDKASFSITVLDY